jgi:hypothetical protein
MERAQPPYVRKTALLTAARWSIKCTVGYPKEMEMAATAHLTLAAPDNERFTVLPAPSRLRRRKASLQAQDW